MFWHLDILLDSYLSGLLPCAASCLFLGPIISSTTKLQLQHLRRPARHWVVLVGPSVHPSVLLRFVICYFRLCSNCHRFIYRGCVFFGLIFDDDRACCLDMVRYYYLWMDMTHLLLTDKQFFRNIHDPLNNITYVFWHRMASDIEGFPIFVHWLET